MGLLDGFFSDDPQKQAQMALALGLLSGNGGKGLSGFARNLGQAGMGAMQTYAFGSENARRNKLADTQNQMSQMQIDEMRRKLSDANTFREVLGGYQAPGPYEDAKASMPSLAPTVANQQTLDAKVAAAPATNGKRAEYERLLGIAKQLEQKGLVDYAQQYYDKARGAMPEVKETKTLTKDGQRVTVNIYKDGSQEVVPFGPDQEKLHFATTGDRTAVGLDQFTGRPVTAGLPVQMSPEQRDASARAWANFNRGDLKEVQRPDGSTGYAFIGSQVSPVGGVSAPGQKPSEQYLKQQTGVENVRSALKDYTDELKNWSFTSAVKPDKRAAMGTVYNNALMQAKEAYNLGVLNGPDYQILQEVLTNPISWKGTITSNKAMAEQAKKLDDLMAKIGKQAAKSHGQPYKGAPSIDDLIKQYGGG